MYEGVPDERGCVTFADGCRRQIPLVKTLGVFDMIGNLILVALLLGFSGYVLYECSHMTSLAALTVIGPDFFPRACAAFCLFAAVVLLITEIYKIATVKVEDRTYVQDELRKTREVWEMVRGNVQGVARMVVIPLLMALYGISLKKVGFEISTFVFLVLSMLVCGQRKIRYLIIVPIVAIIIVYLIFIKFLRVNIPMMFI